MKILILTNLYPPFAIGGYEERCRQVVERLRARGHTVRVLTSTYQATSHPDDQDTHRELMIHGFFGAPWLPIHRLYSLERSNHKILKKHLAQFAPDRVHVWNLGGISKALTLTLQSSGIPVVYDISDHWIARSLKADVWLKWWIGDTGGAPAALLRNLLTFSGAARTICRNAPFAPWNQIEFKHLYFCSEALKELTMRKGYALEHARVIYCGIESGLYTRRTRGSEFSKLLYAGRLSEDKDPLSAIRALANVADKNLTLTLFGHGDADYVALLQKEVAALGLEQRVTFSRADSRQMRSIYAQFDCLLFTSAWEEPFALTPLEAMASGLPVISTLTGGSRELIRHGDNALAYQTSDPLDLARQIQYMQDNPRLREQFALNGPSEVVAKYDWEVIISRIEEMLTQATP